MARVCQAEAVRESLSRCAIPKLLSLLILLDVLPAGQVYAVLVLPNGGTDLETHVFKPSSSWTQACSVFWQIADALHAAEDLVDFEVRRCRFLS